MTLILPVRVAGLGLCSGITGGLREQQVSDGTRNNSRVHYSSFRGSSSSDGGYCVKSARSSALQLSCTSSSRDERQRNALPEKQGRASSAIHARSLCLPSAYAYRQIASTKCSHSFPSDPRNLKIGSVGCPLQLVPQPHDKRRLRNGRLRCLLDAIGLNRWIFGVSFC